MKRSDEGESLDPEVERELDAIERALAGLEVDEEMAPVATLVADLREERPEPDAEWAAELDRRAAAGFGGGASSPLSARFGGFRVRSLLLPAGAVATLAVVAAVGVGVMESQKGGSDAGSPLSAEDAAPASSTAGGHASGSSGSAGGGASAGPSSGLPVPDATTYGQSSSSAGSGSADSGVAAELTPALKNATPAAGTNLGAIGRLSRSSGKLAPGKSKRQEDRSASLTLRTGTDNVGDVSDQAIQITESVGGVVTSSQLSQSKNAATAQLELSIPTRDLDSTLDRLTNLATVASLNEASQDITQPFVSAQDELRDARAQRAKLLEALGNATSDTEAAAIRKQLDDVRHEISRKKAAFAKVARRARMANVSLRIEGSAAENSKGDSWTLGDAASDALDALKTVAGVMLVGAAIVLPIVALVALIAWLAVAWRRRARERTLDE